MSIYRCTICEQQKDSDFNCAEWQGKECCEECLESMEEKLTRDIERVTDLQKQIEELKQLANSADRHTDFEAGIDIGCRNTAEKALSIIKQLQEENKAYIECLRRVNASDDSATQQSRDAHQVLKQFGKL